MDNKQNARLMNGQAYRHNLDLYNGIQTEQLIEKAFEILDVGMSETSQIIINCGVGKLSGSQIRRAKTEEARKKELSETERKQAMVFLKSRLIGEIGKLGGSGSSINKRSSNLGSPVSLSSTSL